MTKYDPNFKQVVEDKFAKLREEVKASREKASNTTYEEARAQASRAMMGITKAPESFWVIQLFEQNGYITSIWADALEEVRALVSKEQQPYIVACSIPFRGKWHMMGEIKVRDVSGAPEVKPTPTKGNNYGKPV